MPAPPPESDPATVRTRTGAWRSRGTRGTRGASLDMAIRPNLLAALVVPEMIPARMQPGRPVDRHLRQCRRVEHLADHLPAGGQLHVGREGGHDRAVVSPPEEQI